MLSILLYNDIKKFEKAEETDRNISKLKGYLSKIQKHKNILIVGSGGSYVTGLYSKYIIENNMDNLCEVLKPMEVLQSNLKIYSYVIIYSYKMKNYDIKTAINYILNYDNIINILIVTAKEPENKFINNKISYLYYDEEFEYEKSYVSYKGIYFPTYLLGSCFENIDINLIKLKNIDIETNTTDILDVFFDKNNYCLAQLVERHFCELGIATVRLHEKKDFSHGRMSILSKECEIIFLNSNNYDIKYNQMLLEYLKNVHKCKILNEKELILNAQLNYFEKMIIALVWIKECSIRHGITMEEKQDTKDDEKLFKYGEENL